MEVPPPTPQESTVLKDAWRSNLGPFSLLESYLKTFPGSSLEDLRRAVSGQIIELQTAHLGEYKPPPFWSYLIFVFEALRALRDVRAEMEKFNPDLYSLPRPPDVPPDEFQFVLWAFDVRMPHELIVECYLLLFKEKKRTVTDLEEVLISIKKLSDDEDQTKP